MAELLLDVDKVIIKGLRLENAILTERLRIIFQCEDKKCCLCGTCIQAVYPTNMEVEPPEIAEDDPIRNTGHSTRHHKPTLKKVS